jgi:hypothetical protein
MWYCAHAIFHYSYVGQSSYVVHENVYLVSADDEDETMLRALKLAAEYEQVGENSHLEIEGRKAEYRFAGIRKLISVDSDLEDSSELRELTGEVTYSVFEVANLSDVVALAAGVAVSVNYRE